MTRTAAAVSILCLALCFSTGAACSSDQEGEDREEKLESAGIKPDVEDDEVQTTSDQTDEEFIEQLEGEVVFNAQLRAGECFNEYAYIDRSGVRQEFTTRVDCNRPHDKEMYAVVKHPASTEDGFIGTDELTLWANKECLRSFEPYVGVAYVLSEIEIGIFQPDLEAWSEPINDRIVRCYLYVDGYNLQGSMNGVAV